MKKVLAFPVLCFLSTLAYGQYLVPSSGSNQIHACSGTIQDHAGGGNYVNNVNGYTVIYPSVGNAVRLTFTQFATESGYDYVAVFNGVGTGGTLLYNQSGAGSLSAVTSTSGPLTIRFLSDVSVVGAGFTATISCVALCSPSITLAAPSASASPGAVCPGGAVTLTSNGVVPGGQGSNSSGVLSLSGSNYVEVASNAAQQVAANTDFTYEMWVKPASFAANNNTYFENGTWAGQTILFRQDNPGNIHLYINGSDQGGIAYAPELSVWTHLALVRSGGAAGTITLYANGCSVGDFTAYAAAINPTTVMRIGSSVHTTGQTFNGAIDEFRFWKGVAVSAANLNSWRYTQATSSHANWANLSFVYRFNGNYSNSGAGTSPAGTGVGSPAFAAANWYTFTWSGSGAPGGSTNEVQTANPTATGSFTVVASRSEYTSSASSTATSSVTVYPRPTGTLTANAYCGAGSGSTGQLVWTASNGTPNYTINYSAAATTNAVGYTGSFNGTAAVGTAQTFSVPWQPIETTTYTVTSISDGNGCTATSLPASVNITVTDAAPSYTIATTTPSGLGTAYSPYAYPVSGTTPPAWGIAGGQTITYSNASWPACANWGISIPSLNASAPTPNPMDLDITDATNTNFSTAKIRFLGSTTHYYMSGGSMISNTLNTRCTITASRPMQYLPSAGYFTVKPVPGSSTNLVINILFETQVPSPAPQFGSYTAGAWVPSLDFYNAIHAPSAGAGSAIYTGFNNGFYFYNINPATAVSASAPSSICINYPSGGVPTGGPVNLTGGTGSLNTSCTLTHNWTSSQALINSTVEDPTPGVANATSTALTTYTYTVSSPSDRVCYGTATTGTPTANTTSPTTWGAGTTNTAGADNWYVHTNWSNCVPCNNTSPACAKQAVIGAATNGPNINTGTAKALSVLGNNLTTNKITIAAPTATLKLITP